MNTELFERLLYEGEGVSLDFKKEQYRFAKATDDEKSELLKDVVGFVNGWRRAEAYILIGVEEVPGGRANVLGIPVADHLGDHSLQQFVNNLTNRPVQFQYEAFGFEGKQVGIIRIEQQRRPIYLKRDYGKLRSGEVYVRRGSSTDPSKPATPDEISQMGTDFKAEHAELEVDFANPDADESLGANISSVAEFCKMPNPIPNYREGSDSDYGFRVNLLDVNSAFWRELSYYVFVRRLFRPMRLVIRNSGKTVAKHVRAECSIGGKTAFLLEHLPSLPERRTYRYDMIGVKEKLLRKRGVIGELRVEMQGDQFNIEVECGDLQPGRSIWTDIVYIGIPRSEEVVLSWKLLADNLPVPKEVPLKILPEISETKMTLAELRELKIASEDSEE